MPSPLQAGEDRDPRHDYDVLAYRLDLAVYPEERHLSGRGFLEVRVEAESITTLVVDLVDELRVVRAVQFDTPLTPRGAAPSRRIRHSHREDRVALELDGIVSRGELVRVAIDYDGHPQAENAFTGFHWEETASGKPWINTSCQDIGAHTWWPCKSSFFSPEDKADRLYVNLDVPAGLVGVANGRMTGRSRRPGRQVFHWEHEYPFETYAVAINVGPYHVVEDELQVAGSDEPVPFVYFVLPEDAEKARVQFAEVPKVIEVFGEAFGPWPFPKAKIGLVQTNFWGMEHTTSIAYGSSFPSWCRETGTPDPFARQNRFLDYILVHEMAHEWWGNAVSAKDWGDFWIHEGMATYAEAVFIERTEGREEADRFFDSLRSMIKPEGRLYRGAGVNSAEAYGLDIYVRGAWVLNTLRHYLDDDALWWALLREFNLRYRYGNASTEDFRTMLEEKSERDWGEFFESWFYGAGYPRLSGRLFSEGKRVVLEVENPVREGNSFRVPVDLRWREGPSTRTERVLVEPGKQRLEFDCSSPPQELEVLHLNRVLGTHTLAVG